MFFLDILSIQCKIRCNRPTETQRSTCWPHLDRWITHDEIQPVFLH